MSVGHAVRQSIYVVGAKRTAFGTFGGTLRGHSPTEMAVVAASAALKSANVAPSEVSSVCVGNVLSSSAADTPYIARHVGLRVGVPVPAPALTVNRKWRNFVIYPGVKYEV
jgi:acetyl-CoA acyltransferase 2